MYEIRAYWLDSPTPYSVEGTYDTDEPAFSWGRCQGCGDLLGGDRHTVAAVWS